MLNFKCLTLSTKILIKPYYEQGVHCCSTIMDTYIPCGVHHRFNLSFTGLGGLHLNVGSHFVLENKRWTGRSMIREQSLTKNKCLNNEPSSYLMDFGFCCFHHRYELCLLGWSFFVWGVALEKKIHIYLKCFWRKKSAKGAPTKYWLEGGNDMLNIFSESLFLYKDNLLCRWSRVTIFWFPYQDTWSETLQTNLHILFT